MLHSNNGNDLLQIVRACAAIGYDVGADVIDAEWFVPQSRPRLFVLAVRKGLEKAGAESSNPFEAHAGKTLSNLPDAIKPYWRRWYIPPPTHRRQALPDIIESLPSGVEWHSEEQTSSLVKLMSEANWSKFKAAQEKKSLQIGTLYRRTRIENGVKVQRAEIRFDSIAGCLRTPAGGSSRQVIIAVQGKTVRTRLLSPKEAARLMGLPDSYILPARYNEAYHLLGDGVVVPLVSHLADHFFKPIIDASSLRRVA